MANVINTRIQLKYDSLSNWNTSTFKPLKGEICIAKVDVTQPENGLLQPIMFKVGDGDHTFAELGWTSAKAADVYAWAKAAELPVDDTLATEGKFVVGFDWEGDKLVPKFRDFVTEINETNKDKLDAPTTKAVKTYVDGKIADVVAQGTVVAAGDGIDVVQSGNVYTVSHEDTSNVANVTATARTYITGLTFDEFGHVTGTTTGSESDQDTGVMSVSGKEAIKVTGDDEVEVSLALDPAKGNVELTQSDAGLKANVDLSAYRLIADDENTEYHIEYDSTARKIKLVAGANAEKMSIDATEFIKDGMIDSVELVAADGEGKSGQFLKITWNSDAGKSITYIDVTTLVDVYTGTDGNDIKVTVTSDKKIEATIKADALKTTLGLGSAAYTDTGAYATAEQGAAAEKATDDIADILDGTTSVAKADAASSAQIADKLYHSISFGSDNERHTWTETFNGTEDVYIDFTSYDEKIQKIKDTTDQLAGIATTGSIYDVAEGANVSTGKDDPANTEYLIFNCGSATTII